MPFPSPSHPRPPCATACLALSRRTLVLGTLGTLGSAALPFGSLALAQQKFINVLTGG